MYQFCNYLQEVNSKFETTASNGSFVLHSFSYQLIKYLQSCKNQRSRWKKNLKGLSIKWEVAMFIYIRVLRLRSTDWKSFFFNVLMF